MDVILKEDVDNLGQKGQVVHVTPGYARNFLFARSLAVAATEGNIKNLQHFMAAAEKKREAAREEAKKVADKLAELEIKIEARAGEKNRLFGSVTGQQIADAINQAMDLKLDKKKVAAGSGIKLLGKHKVMVTVYPGVTVEKEIEVVASASSDPSEAVEKEEKPAKKARAAKKAPQSASRAESRDLPEEKVEVAPEEAPTEIIEESQETTDVSIEESAADAE
ncbi:MAG: 50S ribosomal protein L9 [Actinomycetota bacterium]